MCVYSAISDWGRSTFTPVTQPPTWVYPPPPDNAAPAKPTVTLTKADWDAFKRLLDAAKKFDDVTGQPDCESAEKTAWMKEVEERLAKLTEKVG